jgi:hypothetical protein
MSSSRHSGPVRLLLRVAVFACLFLVVAEVWLRTVMPACETPVNYQRDPATITRYDPQGPSPGLYTVGRRCRRAGEWRINNAGWNSAVDYLAGADREKPLIAIFGDSYIEGFLTDDNEHVDAYLPKMLPGTDAYAFGLSGWYLEQYVAVSRYAQERFQPDVLVIFLGSGDVSDSLLENGVIMPRWWQIAELDGSFKEVPPTEIYVGSRKNELAKRSALLNYLRYNAEVSLPGAPGGGVAQPATESGPPSGGGPPAAGDDAWRDLLPAADFMVDRLCRQHPGTPIIFAARGDRYLSLEDVATTPLLPDALAVQQAAAGRAQCSFIDLRYAFSLDWATHHVRFESDADGAHWNAYANRLVARTLADFISANIPLGDSGMDVP